MVEFNLTGGGSIALNPFHVTAVVYTSHSNTTITVNNGKSYEVNGDYYSVLNAIIGI